MSQNKPQKGLMAALLTPFFMGMAPVFGKLALHTGFDPYTLAAIRTCLAALALWTVYLLFFRRYTFIFTAGLVASSALLLRDYSRENARKIKKLVLLLFVVGLLAYVIGVL